jgi:hypothetical protein
MWKSITPSNSPKYMVKGTELNYMFAGVNSRYAIVEVRSYDKDRNADRSYIIRDAYTVSDEDIKNGVRPKIVARFDFEDDALKYCQNNS